ncbi:acyltransferase family protein [Prosthecobacter sp.]|uniref:acyltransferase family protein n=1 Tax=Prosthecobacter sp. TaxID=1965333 RepID=UPI003783BDA9
MNELSITPATPSAPRPARLVSVDALRGFDMFWIIGGEQVAHALEQTSGGPLISTLATQLQHVEWAGFHFYDAIFPLFLFLVGVAIVLSLNPAKTADGRRPALMRILRRSALLFGIGVLYYGGIARPWPDVALSGVLPRIALCYLSAATLHLFLPRKGIIMAALACLMGYWALLTFAPFPDVSLKHPTVGKKGPPADARTPAQLFAGAATTHGVFEEGRNFTHYVDATMLPGRKRNFYYTNEGLLSTIPAVATTLFGIMAGWVLTTAGWSGYRKAAWLLGAGAVGVVLGLLWGLDFPIIKRIWTSSFCLLAAGVSSLFLGVFYLVIDVWRCQRWATPFLWIGANALTAYLLVSVVNFEELAARFVGGDVRVFLDTHLASGAGLLTIALVGLLLPVLLLRFLYQRKIFIRL